jgi:LysM repeat protein
MNRGQLAFLVLVNTMISLVIALAVVWAFEARRPDPEELAAINTPRPGPVLAVSSTQPPATPDLGAAVPTTVTTEPAEAAPIDTPASTGDETGEETVEGEVYVVQPGDTMLVIATRNNITVDDILRANNLSDPNFLFSGQRLVIPVQGAGGAVQSEAPTAAPSGAEPGTDLGTDPGTDPVVEGVRIASIIGAGDVASEHVVIVNESSTPFSLQGWQIQSVGGPGYLIASDVPLFAGGSVRIHSEAGTNTTIDLYWGLTEPVWSSGMEARLINAQGDVVNSYIVP